MGKLLINNDYLVEGKFSIFRQKNDVGEIVVMGALETSLYIEEINEIASGYYRIKGVDVHKESFGSEDDSIIYEFTAKEVEISPSKAGEEDDE